MTTPAQSNTENIFKALIKSVFKVEDTDYAGTLESVKNDIAFKGFNVWILIFSILICSIGLNINSTAVVIGAMLISPLMGPINGIGFAVGTYDNELLMRSLKNFLVAVALAVVTSYIYFILAPEGDNISELEARTNPTLLDLLIAVFGGLSGFLGNSRQVKTNVIPGVAIATALMPPLCTAGFGLATGRYDFFVGAIYLFFINSVFISLATLLMVRYLRFPFRTYPDEASKKRVRSIIIFFVLLVSVPSIYIYMGVIKQTLIRSKINDFIDTQIESTHNHVFEKNVNFTDSVTRIEIAVIGDHIPQQRRDSLNGLLPANGLENCVLVIYQGEDDTEVKSELLGKINESKAQIINEVYKQNAGQIEEKNANIELLTSQLRHFTGNGINMPDLFRELTALDYGVAELAYARALKANEMGSDTTALFLVNWQKGRKTATAEQSLRNWLKTRTQIDTFLLINR